MARDREKSKEIVILLAGDTEIVNGHEVNTRQSCGVNRMRRKERQRKYWRNEDCKYHQWPGKRPKRGKWEFIGWPTKQSAISEMVIEMGGGRWEWRQTDGRTDGRRESVEMGTLFYFGFNVRCEWRMADGKVQLTISSVWRIVKEGRRVSILFNGDSWRYGVFGR